VAAFLVADVAVLPLSCLGLTLSGFLSEEKATLSR
jgi:hypothetical protein